VNFILVIVDYTQLEIRIIPIINMFGVYRSKMRENIKTNGIPKQIDVTNQDDSAKHTSSS